MRSRARGWTFLAVASALVLAAPGALRPVRAASGPTQIWFTPLTWSAGGGQGPVYTTHDFPALLRPDAPWQTAASRVSVLTLPGNVVWSYHDIPALLAFLHRHAFKVGFGLGVMFDGGQCAPQEAISHDPDMNREAVHIARMWKQDGGTLDYILMDSPLWFGHFEPTGCRFPTAEVARRSAITLRAIFEQFPNAKIVDAEGPGPLPIEQWLPEMAAFGAAIRADTGHAMEGVSLDLHWHDPRMPLTWQETARRSAAYFHRLGMFVGQIFNAPGGANMTLPAWMEVNREHLREGAEARLGLDFIVLDQWQNVARMNLPESDPNAYTSLINDAFADFRGAP